MLKKSTAAWMLCVLVLTGLFFTGCSKEEGDTLFTNPVINASQSENQPALQLEHYSDAATEDESRKRAVGVTFSDYLMGEMDENGTNAKSLQMDTVDIADFENGFVADITMTVEMDNAEKTDRRVLGYFKTVQLPDGTYRTYFIYYNDVGQNDTIEDKTKEDQLNDVLDKVQKDENTESGASSGNASSANSSSQSGQSGASSAQSSSADENPESINDIDIDDLL